MRIIKIGPFEVWSSSKAVEFWWGWKLLFEIPRKWMRKIFLVIAVLIFLTSFARADQLNWEEEGSSYTVQWGITGSGWKLQFNPMEEDWEYAPPGAIPQYDPEEDRWRLTPPGSDWGYPEGEY